MGLVGLGEALLPNSPVVAVSSPELSTSDRGRQWDRLQEARLCWPQGARLCLWRL